MGACFFTAKTTGKNAREAFERAVDSARWENGHGGYTGTIAEKSDFVLLGAVETVDAAYAMIDTKLDDVHIRDKWGPAGLIRVTTEDAYVFFGYASS
jgi:hypothetical protein